MTTISILQFSQLTFRNGRVSRPFFLSFRKIKTGILTVRKERRFYKKMHRSSKKKILETLSEAVSRAWNPRNRFIMKLRRLAGNRNFRTAAICCSLGAAAVAVIPFGNEHVSGSIMVEQTSSGTVALPEAAMEAETLELKKAEEISLDENETVWYSYTPGVDGTYSVRIKDGRNVNCSVTDSSGTRLESASETVTESGTKLVTYQLTAGEPVTVALSSGDDSSVSLCLDKTSRPSLAEGESDLTVSINGNDTIDFADSADISDITWESSDTSVAVVDESGNVTGVSGGTATITATGTDSEGYPFTAESEVTVQPPSLDRSSISLNIGDDADREDGYYTCSNNTVTISNLPAGAEVTCATSSEDLKVETSYDGTPETAVYTLLPAAEGDYTVTFSAGGTELTLSVSVITASISESDSELRSTLTIYNGETVQLETEGFPDGAEITWSSSDPDVASVDSSGNVTGNGYGTCTITADCNGATASYNAKVLSKGAVMAVRYCYDHYNSTYSQGRRMSSGYYDCSSYVWRGYDYGDSGFGDTTAPTAAAQAKWCVENGYMIYYGTVSTDDLQPGDLIYSCGGSNGRYKGIYHVDIYTGGRQSLTVARTKNLSGTLKNVMIARPYGTSITYLKGSMQDYSSLSLKWDELFGAGTYDLYRSTSEDGDYEKIASVDTNSYTDTDVEYGTTYYYKVQATWNGTTTYSGNMSNAFSVSMTYSSPELSVSEDGQSLAWEAADVSGYTIYRSESQDGEFTELATISDPGDTSYTDTSAESGKEYFYQIRSYVERDGNTYQGASSNTVSVTCP